MGLDLSLLPFDHESESLAFSHSIIGLPRKRDAFDAIFKLNAIPVPSSFHTYMATQTSGERGYGNTQTTPYSEKLLCVTMGDLMGLFDGPEGAFIDACNPDRKVALFWH